MSKQKIARTPGLQRVVDKELPLAVKVTGHHLGAVTYLVSLAAERRETRAAMSTFFNDDGSLAHIAVTDGTGSFEAKPGYYLVLPPDDVSISVMDEATYRELLRPIYMS